MEPTTVVSLRCDFCGWEASDFGEDPADVLLDLVLEHNATDCIEQLVW